MALSKSTRELLKRSARRSVPMIQLSGRQKVSFMDLLRRGPTKRGDENALAHRLQEVGIDPNSIHIPPPIAEISEGGVLPPPTPPVEANIGFFERLRRR